MDFTKLFSLEGKIALITGGSRGIGKMLLEGYLAAGCERVYITARKKAQLDETVAEFEAQYPGKVIGLAGDISQMDGVKQLAEELAARESRLDVLVNNAGILDDALIGMVTPAQIERTFASNSFSVLYCSQYAARMMQRAGGGSIINLSSIIGRVGNAGQAVYGGSKAAVIGMTQSLAKELAPQQIRVNAIAPGFIDTDMAHSLPEEKFQQRLQSIAMGRIGSADEVANVALFLASGLSSYVTGQVIGVDGGMLI